MPYIDIMTSYVATILLDSIVPESTFLFQGILKKGWKSEERQGRPGRFKWHKGAVALSAFNMNEESYVILSSFMLVLQMSGILTAF